MVWHGMVWSICPISRPFLVSHAQRGVGAVSLVPSHFLRLVQDACLYCLVCPACLLHCLNACTDCLYLHCMLVFTVCFSAFPSTLLANLLLCSAYLFCIPDCTAFPTLLPTAVHCLFIYTVLFPTCICLFTCLSCLSVSTACLLGLPAFQYCL
jgi:hypothetical protein